MFDKLIECEPKGADFKSRRSYFMVSSVVVGIFFVTAVVVSLYAADISLGHDNFVVSTMLAPVEPPPDKPEVEAPRPETTTARSDSPVPTRQTNMARVDETKFVPDSISNVPNRTLSRPITGFRIDPNGTESDSSAYRGPARGVSSGPAVEGLSTSRTVSEAEKLPEPPPAVKIPVKRPPTSLGVINGRASYLPKPAYPTAAISLNVQGTVEVQVLIDEAGNVISAKAINGHPLLRNAAVRSASSARFSPTKLSNVPVKVTGVIVYNFTR